MHDYCKFHRVFKQGGLGVTLALVNDMLVVMFFRSDSADLSQSLFKLPQIIRFALRPFGLLRHEATLWVESRGNKHLLPGRLTIIARHASPPK